MADNLVEKVDAGLADAEKAAAEAAEYEAAAAEFPDEDVPGLAESLEILLFNPHVQPAPKVLLMSLVWLGQPVTAANLAKGSGLSKTQVFHALKGMVELGIVTETQVPDVKLLKFTRHYSIEPEARSRFGLIGSTTTTEAAAADSDESGD